MLTVVSPNCTSQGRRLQPLVQSTCSQMSSPNCTSQGRRQQPLVQSACSQLSAPTAPRREDFFSPWFNQHAHSCFPLTVPHREDVSSPWFNQHTSKCPPPQHYTSKGGRVQSMLQSACSQLSPPPPPLYLAGKAPAALGLISAARGKDAELLFFDCKSGQRAGVNCRRC